MNVITNMSVDPAELGQELLTWNTEDWNPTACILSENVPKKVEDIDHDEMRVSTGGGSGKP